MYDASPVEQCRGVVDVRLMDSKILVVTNYFEKTSCVLTGIRIAFASEARAREFNPIYPEPLPIDYTRLMTHSLLVTPLVAVNNRQR
jgi:hypothetical protein